MKKIAALLFVFLLISNFLWAKQVELKRALNIATNFLQQQNSELKSAGAVQLIPASIQLPGESRLNKTKSSKVNDHQMVYLFKNGNQGFVIVSGEDRVKPILGYSTTENIDENNLPVNMLKWMEEYKRQIRYVRDHPEMKSYKAVSEWNLLETGKTLEKASPNAVGALMTTTWNQAPFYNELCPQEYWFSKKAVTGCVATGMAQVMKYHNWPKQGQGIHSYYHSNNSVTYGTLTANFGATTYDWTNMPNALTGSSSSTQITAIATLMLHCGVGVNMNYSPESSGAWVTEARSQAETCAEYALKEFFGYDATSVKGIQREGKTTSEWINLLKSELDAKRPVLFAGIGDGGGHCFVADGYDNNYYFHMNWGWGGIADGYYSVDAFNPDELGTGGGNGGFNTDQRVVIGIKPPATTSNFDIRLYDNITHDNIYQFTSARVSMKLANYGTSTFSGDLGLAIFDEYGDFVDFFETFAANLDPDTYYNVFFDNEGLSVYPGTYFFGVYYKPPEGNWEAVGDGDYENFVSAEVLSPFGDSDIKLYDSIHVSPTPVVTGEPLKVWANIGNWGTSTYNGEFGAGMFTLQGDVVQTIEVVEANGLESGYFDNYEFNTSSVEAEPGSYLVGLVHFPPGSSDQEVIAPYDYVNPIRINVTVPPLGPDDFENNNEVNNAYQFEVNFVDDYDGFYTIGTSIHSDTDQDYYMMDLPKGYTYTILAKSHDSYNSDLGDFTADVIWAHSDDGEWSDLYDDEMDAPYKLYNGGQIYFGVIPYFEGQTGSYAFSLEILREIYTDVDEITNSKGLKVYPNPVADQLKINSQTTIDLFELYNGAGQKITSQRIGQKNFNIPVKEYTPGLYFLKLYNEEEIITKKITINE